VPAPAEAPPHWKPYFRVDDVDATAAKAAGEGGGVLLAPADVPGEDLRVSVLKDPQGAQFGVFCSTRPQPAAEPSRVPGMSSVPGVLPGEQDLPGGHVADQVEERMVGVEDDPRRLARGGIITPPAAAAATVPFSPTATYAFSTTWETVNGSWSAVIPVRSASVNRLPRPSRVRI
jgi:hypothetical protein